MAEVAGRSIPRRRRCASRTAPSSPTTTWSSPRGATHSYFGHDDWAAYAPGLKTLEDALDIRARVLLAFERAERETDPAKRAAWLTFVVIGAGATGVELAGTLAEIARHTLRGEFRRIDPHKARIVLIEGARSRAAALPAGALARRRCEQLERLGVDGAGSESASPASTPKASRWATERIAAQDRDLGSRRGELAARAHRSARRSTAPAGSWSSPT